jgi:tetratricopeptide (TPR) repeat protein
LKKLLAIVTLSSMLSACASWKHPADAEQTAKNSAGAPSDQSAAKEPDPKPAPAPRVDPSVPNVTLNEELLFKILSSEIAFQRGQWQAAYVTLMAAAQDTRDPRLAKRAAEFAVSARSPIDALKAVRLWIELAPQSDEALQNYLSLVVLTDNLPEAEQVLARRLQAASLPTRGPIMLQMQRLISRAKDKDAAFALTERIVAPYLDMVEAHVALAQAAIAKADIPRAREEADIAVKINPDSELAVLTQAQVAADPAQAIANIEDFLRRNPGAREVRIAYARTLVERKQYDAARIQFARLLQEQPGNLNTLLALGLLNAQTNHPKEADQYLSQYVAILAKEENPERDPTQALLVLSQLAEERNDIPAALKWLDQVESGEAYIPAQIRRAQLTAKAGNMNGAREILHLADTTGEGDQTRLIMAESQILRDAGQSQASFDVLEAGLKRFPDNIDLLYDHAMAADKLNAWDIMEVSLRKIMRIAPNNQQAYNALGYSLADRNIRLDDALELITKALSLAPEDAFITDSLGWVQFRMGKLAEAEATLIRAYNLRPDTEIAMHLGEVLWTEGKRDEAMTAWRAAYAKEPANEALTSTLKRFNVSL